MDFKYSNLNLHHHCLKFLLRTRRINRFRLGFDPIEPLKSNVPIKTAVRPKSFGFSQKSSVERIRLELFKKPEVVGYALHTFSLNQRLHNQSDNLQSEALIGFIIRGIDVDLTPKLSCCQD